MATKHDDKDEKPTPKRKPEPESDEDLRKLHQKIESEAGGTK
jgi:hypothetical protein